MSAIVGLREEQVREIIRQTDSRDHPLFVANINAPRQIAISGSIEAMEKALELARHRGARKAVRLGVSVPSHCPLFGPVADCLRAALAGMDVEEPKITYVGNITGRALRDAKTIAADITGNVAHTIRWHEGTTVLTDWMSNVFEMPPGHALTDLAREASKMRESYPSAKRRSTTSSKSRAAYPLSFPCPPVRLRAKSR